MYLLSQSECVCVFWSYISADQTIFIDSVAKQREKSPFPGSNVTLATKCFSCVIRTTK